MQESVAAKGMVSKPARALQEKGTPIVNLENKRPLIFTSHFGKPVLAEAEPIKIAKVPSGEQLHESVLIHKRYVPEGTDHEIIEVLGLRRGRSLDVLLDEPIKVNGEEYGVLNFKGVGADADRDMVIHPKLWWAGDRWLCSHDGRIFGALGTGGGRGEYANNLFADNNILQVPHLALNEVDGRLWKKTLENEMKPEDKWHGSYPSHLEGFRPVQLLRLLQTNIRLDATAMTSLRYGQVREFVDAERFASGDSNALLLDKKLRMDGSAIKFDGEVYANRFIDARFTDMENVELYNNTRCFSFETFPSHAIIHTARFLGGEELVKYLKVLEEKTGLPFTSTLNGDGHFFESIRNTVMLAFRKSPEK
ncbi:Uncharacterised protein [uncultured archaeon]|nr:Uncharacterised protein [uncultured archaeon]